MGYLIARGISLAIRVVICFYTIETTPIFANKTLGWVFGQIISIYYVMLLISFFIVGSVFKYKRGSDPILGVMLYGVVYIVITLVMWGVLAFLTLLGVLPV
jgi:hypothetical protein